MREIAAFRDKNPFTPLRSGVGFFHAVLRTQTALRGAGCAESDPCRSLARFNSCLIA
jgi:hypothetical protein